MPRKGAVEVCRSRCVMGYLKVEWDGKSPQKISSASGNIWQNLKCKHIVIHKFHLQEFILQELVLLGANIYGDWVGSGANCLGLRPGSATVNEASVKYVMSHIDLLRVLNKLKHAIGFEP